MRDRIGFWGVSCGLVLALAGCGGDPCEAPSDLLADTCTGFDIGDFNTSCGRVEDRGACAACVETALEGGAAACGTVRATCEDECFACPDGLICPSADGGTPLVDSGPPRDGGPPAACGTTGYIGATCRGGTTCQSPLTCEAEFAAVMGGAPATLGNLFDIPSGTPDPANADEFIAGEPSDIPVLFAPGGQCTQGCNNATQAMPDDGCGMCATCSDTLGGAPSFAGVGISALIFSQSPRNAAGTVINDGICRLNCAYNPATRGGCPTGYTCDAGTNICIESCTADSQCNIGWGISRSDGLVAYDNGVDSTCNTTTGRCDYTAPAGAGLNTECEESTDCPDPGICLIGGRCGTFACADPTGMMAGSGPDCMAAGGECLGFGGNGGSLCVDGCTTPDDCFPGQACSPFTAALPSGATGFCFGVCDEDAECRGTERCREIREDDPDTTGDDSLSTCSTVCDPDTAADPAVPNAVACETNEICVQHTGEDYGYCQPINQICFADDDCNGGQACEVLGTDLYGRCVEGCASAADCGSGELCRIQTGKTIGVCRVVGGACSRSPENTAMMVIQPLRGSAQCAPGQTCAAAAIGVASTCMGAALDGGVVPTDAGTPATDAGTDAGTPATDAGSDAGSDAGTDAGP